MTIEEIRKNAPAGATHYSDLEGEVVFYQKTNNLIFWDDVYNVWDEIYFELPELKPPLRAFLLLCGFSLGV